MKIILPKYRLPGMHYQANLPLFFPAGPIRGGGDWQHTMCLAIQKEMGDREFLIACPCRWRSDHPLAPHFLPKFEGFECDRQLAWEQYYLLRAGVTGPGCIIFWLPLESKESPHPGPEPYAMDTRGEIGEWRMRMEYQKARVVIGGNPNFHGLSQIQRNFSHVLRYDFPIHTSMEAVAKDAVTWALYA